MVEVVEENGNPDLRGFFLRIRDIRAMPMGPKRSDEIWKCKEDLKKLGLRYLVFRLPYRYLEFGDIPSSDDLQSFGLTPADLSAERPAKAPEQADTAGRIQRIFQSVCRLLKKVLG